MYINVDRLSNVHSVWFHDYDRPQLCATVMVDDGVMFEIFTETRTFHCGNDVINCYCSDNCLLHSGKRWYRASQYIDKGKPGKFVVVVLWNYLLYRNKSKVRFLLFRYWFGLYCPRWLHCYRGNHTHYNDVILSTMASQITSFTIVYWTIYTSVDQRKHQSSASLTFFGEFTGDRWIPCTKGQ